VLGLIVVWGFQELYVFLLVIFYVIITRILSRCGDFMCTCLQSP
jgi:hypothetical protein